ncbi:bifunctional tRNA pseudouridine(32) synthase/23S rRNA pseudouridine(746) synthase RluA [Salinimonas sp. HHU 13199]|uniref:Dual-specificity RNA pseudouridine synthase RluA n=1 Tax=Salinimonas profundi TaxID=2729140 RepID=A0ABR8LNM2_9ALTE|nr:bifunctional tRNA pseudouridine(32) synthase/23S rRNA pseudouridine(746) synthase RluA [Salinimonas profundi]MBD3586032.1 bifunctional tRNA pseudouridine(32) synthase/23S rRNA pseudouridine(746) synthase RluA [Salinimonas profundi]
MANPPFVYNPPLSPYLDILYQDEAILVANKPSGLLSVPGKADAHKDSLITRVKRVYPNAAVVHRLDMATSGIMIMALTKDANRFLSQQFATRQTQKRYYARVDGCMRQPAGMVDLPLICDWPNRPKQMVCHDNGKPSVTYYSVVSKNDSESLVALKPVTGRSHQLRVHMLALGHPILGDRLYAHPEALAKATRLQLHAQTLIIRHPETSQWCHFETAIPFSDHKPEPLAVPEYINN